MASSLKEILDAITGLFATASQGAKADTAVQPGDLATVATTGQYGDLLGLPNLANVPFFVFAGGQNGPETGSRTLVTYFTLNGDLTYQVGGYINIGAISAGTLVYELNYTDALTNTPQVYTLSTQTAAGIPAPIFPKKMFS